MNGGRRLTYLDDLSWEQSLMSGSLYSYALLTFVRVISFLYQMLVGPSGDYHSIVLFGVLAFVYYMEW